MINRKREFVKNTLILTIGKFLPKLISILIIPIITAKLTKVEYGTYDLISTIVALLLPIATLQLPSAAFRFLVDYRGNEKKTKAVISNIVIATFSISLLVCIVMFFVLSKLSFITRVLICSYFLLDIIYYVSSQICRGLSYNKYYSISSVLFSIINLFSIYLTLNINSYGLNGVLISLCLAYFIATTFIVIKTHLVKYIDVKLLNKKNCVEFVKYSWPMIPNNLSAWVLNVSDRLVINHFLGIEMTAVYAVANKIPNILSIFQEVFNLAWQENASLTVKDKDVDIYYSNMFSIIFNFMIGGTALLIGFTPLIFKILIKGDYFAAYKEMPILIFAMLFCCLSSFLGGIYIAHKKTKELGISTLIVSIINLSIDLLLVKHIGITTGSISTLVAYMSLYIYRLININKFQKIKVNIKKQIIYFIIVILMLAVCTINNFKLNLANMMISIAFSIIVNFEFLRKLMTILLKKLK